MLSTDMAFGARDRLLPATIPFRFFAAALVFHAAGWLSLALGNEPLVGFRGGPGPVLAGLHLFTLGTLASVAIGASYQLLPMATVRAVGSPGWARLSFFAYAPGVALLATGLALASPELAMAGGVLTVAGLAIFAGLMIDNLRAAGEMPLVRRHALTALLALAGTAGLGLTLLADLHHGFLPDHAALAGVHLAVAVFGFMGMLVAGFSGILVPMLALGPAPSPWLGRRVAWAAEAGLVLAVVGGVTGVWGLTLAGALFGGLAGGLHLWAMAGVLKARMRKRLGVPFVLIRGAWTMLALSLGLAVALAAGMDAPNLPTVFGVVAVGGWLMSFLFGVLQRIAPFLASVHLTAPGRRPPLVSALTPQTPLRIHAALHALALSALALANLLDLEALARAGALAGVAGAAALLIAGARLALNVRRAANAPPPVPRSRKPGGLPCSP